MKFTLEICAGSLRSAVAAQQGGADRIELCDNLYEGGTTPSYGLIKTCRSLLDIPIFPIIRPRGGNFIYTDQEFEVMKQDIIACSQLGCEGVVYGILQPDGSIDVDRCSELASIANGMELTFHRAFDRCSNREMGLEEIINTGFHRILTSGGMEHAGDAIAELKWLVKQAGNRLSIMPGSGITPQNLLDIANETGAFEFHTTAKSRIHQASEAYSNNLDTQYLYETDIVKVKEMRGLLNSFRH